MRSAAGAALVGLALVVSACGGDAAKKPAAKPVAPGAPKVQADRKEQEELSRQVKAFVLTDKVVDGIAASDKDLADFWANPVESRKILGQLTLTGILDAIEKAPRVKETFAKHGLAPRDYILGTFSMIGGYSYEVVKKTDPKKVEGHPAPVSDATLQVIERRLDDVEKIVRPQMPVPKSAAPATASAPATGR